MAVADPIVGVGKILIVEDDRHELRALSEFLERKGYSVIEAQNGREALDDLRNGAAVSLVLLDLSMPVMDGWEFLKRQNNDPAIADIPVVALTASPQQGALFHVTRKIRVLRDFNRVRALSGHAR